MIACAHCGTAMPTPTGQASRKRYCGVHCRKAAWRERHRHDPVHPAVPAVPAVPPVPPVPRAFPDDVPTPGGHHHCPNCRQPLAIISVVIPADAAIVNPPEVLPQATQTANLKPPPGEDDVATLGNFGERQQAAICSCRLGELLLGSICVGLVPGAYLSEGSQDRWAPKAVATKLLRFGACRSVTSRSMTSMSCRKRRRLTCTWGSS